MKKYIHYCWFGNKPLPKLAKRCIKSWEKYLPDFEIKKWSEENVDLDECPFVRQAYDNKKWAFVADYVRTKVLKEYGGIYFDTDMEVIKDITSLLENETFLGVEDSGFIAVGVWYEKKKGAFLPTELLKIYKSMDTFDVNNLASISIPRLITKIVEPFGFVNGSSNIQRLEQNISIYPREYFYPYSYNRDDNIFTDDTCMIHYYDASWIPFKEKFENNLVRKIGRKKTYALLNSYRKGKVFIRNVGKTILFPVVLYKNHKVKLAVINDNYLNRINNTKSTIDNLAKKNAKYFVFHNNDWFGITSATKELFDNLVDCGELYRKEDIALIGDAILSSGVSQVIFSAFVVGWKDLAKYIRKHDENIKLKTFWHGSHSQVLDYYGWERNLEIIDLHKKGIIDVMGTCKKSLLDFYLSEGFDAVFITNKVETDVVKSSKKDNKFRIGIYAARCNDWRKNMYAQMSAVRLIDNAVLDMVPLNEEAKSFANIIGLKIEGEEKPIPREKLMERMSRNSINLYITFSECAPMLPLESFNVDTPCITGNNHHYFENSELEKYIVVNNEEDVVEIKEKIEYCLNNKEKVMKLYADFKKKNILESNNDVKSFLEK